MPLVPPVMSATLPSSLPIGHLLTDVMAGERQGLLRSGRRVPKGEVALDGATLANASPSLSLDAAGLGADDEGRSLTRTQEDGGGQ
jgi:hypothetical protein